MAELNPNIILSGQAPQIESPLDALGKAMQYKAMANQSQMQSMQLQQEQQAFSDQQAMRNALAGNTTVDQNGNPSVDRSGVMKSLAQSAPHLAPQAAMNFAQQDAAIQKNQMEVQHAKWSALGQIMGGVTDEDSYQQALKQAAPLGVAVDQLPPHYDPSVVHRLMVTSMDAKDNLANQLQTQELAVKQQEAQTGRERLGIEREDLAMKRQQYLDTKAEGNFKDMMSHAESSRQLPDVKQAYIDRYQTQKVLDLVGNGDPNKISPKKINLLVAEVGKVATGGAPTEETLKGLTPENAKMIQSKMKEYFSAHPEAGQQGAWVNAFKDYAETLQSGANKVIAQNMGQLRNMYQGHVRDNDLKSFDDTFIKGNPYEQELTKKQSDTYQPGSQAQDGDTYTYNNTTYKVVGDHWIAQPTKTARK